MVLYKFRIITIIIIIIPVRPWTWTGLHADAIQPVARIPDRQRLRSSSMLAMDVLSTRLPTVGDRAFPVARHEHGTVCQLK